jgi:hypothetical protein
VIFRSRFILVGDSFTVLDGNLSVNRIIIRIYNYMRKRIRIIKIDSHLDIIIIGLRRTLSRKWSPEALYEQYLQ